MKCVRGYVWMLAGVVLALVVCPGSALGEQLIVPVPCPEIDLARDHQGLARFTGSELRYSATTGEPMLPSVAVSVLLPPDTDLEAVRVWVREEQLEAVPGAWKVAAMPPPVTWDQGKEIKLWPEDRKIIDGKVCEIYQSDALFPTSAVTSVRTGRLHDWKILDAEVSLFRHNPVSGRLLRLRKASLAIDFKRQPVPTAGKAGGARTSLAGEARVRRIVSNFDSIAPEYHRRVGFKASSDSKTTRKGYAILTTQEIRDSCPVIYDFISHKEQHGFQVFLVTEEAWGGGAGNTAADNIRAWLCANYQLLNLEYVLLIGDPHPDRGTVAMKRLWPSQQDSTPSDYYFADLSGNWDLDGDTRFGEGGTVAEGGDFGPGGVDAYYEVVVGRIPYYWNLQYIPNILQRTMAYENVGAEQTTWRRNVLLAIGEGLPNAHYPLEAIKDEVIIPNGWSYHRVYITPRDYLENYNLDPPPETITPGSDASSIFDVVNVWTGADFGAVGWRSHGSTDTAYWILESPWSSYLSSDRPVMTYQASCDTANPDQPYNLAYSLLRDGAAVATVGAARGSYSWPWGEYPYTEASNEGMIFHYFQGLIVDELSCGYALHELRRKLFHTAVNLPWWVNLVTYCLYGDPSVRLYTSTLWIEDMSDTSGWDTWRSTISANGDGTATQTESGPDVWGKTWFHVGSVDVDTARYLHVNLTEVSGVAKVAVSGPWDSDYQEVIGTSHPGEYMFDLAAWPANGPGNEDLFVQLIVQEEGASATYDQVSILSSPPVLDNPPPEVTWSEDMSDVSEWGAWRATFATTPAGTAVLSENGPEAAGKAWAYVGTLDADQYRYLNVTITSLTSTAKVAVSGPYDQDYWEVTTVDTPGEYSLDISSWPGNVLGPEELFVQLIVEGEGGTVTFGALSLSSAQL